MASRTSFGFHHSPPPKRTQQEIDAIDPAIERVFGVGTEVIAGVIPIEDGSGALPKPVQILHGVKRILREQGREAAAVLIHKLIDGGHTEAVDLLVADGLVKPETSLPK